MDTFISRSPEETQALGENWGKTAAAGLVIGLTGDLGAGKTELVKGLARGLGVQGKVHSPTFALVHEYSGGRLPLFHLDLYRLETSAQIVGAGLEEYLYNPAGVTIVEWVERWRPAGFKSRTGNLGDEVAPGRYKHVFIETLGETERRIAIED